MLEIGKTFVKNGATFCLIHMLNYNNAKYAIFSVEKNASEISFLIYNVIENVNGYDLEQVYDDNLKFALFEMIEREAE